MDIRVWLNKNKSKASTSRDDATKSSPHSPVLAEQQVQADAAAATNSSIPPPPSSSRTHESRQHQQQHAVPGPPLPRPPDGSSSMGHAFPDDLGVDKPKQVRLENYPVRYFSGKKRSFSFAWYQNRPWLEYSVKRDAAFCFPCRLFSSTSHTSSDLVFKETGFRDWKHAIEKIKV